MANKSIFFEKPHSNENKHAQSQNNKNNNKIVHAICVEMQLILEFFFFK